MSTNERKETGFISGELKPVRIGVYKRRFHNGTHLFSYWNGRWWGRATSSPLAATVWRKEASIVQDAEWCGLVHWRAV